MVASDVNYSIPYTPFWIGGMRAASTESREFDEWESKSERWVTETLRRMWEAQDGEQHYSGWVGKSAWTRGSS